MDTSPQKSLLLLGNSKLFSPSFSASACDSSLLSPMSPPSTIRPPPPSTVPFPPLRFLQDDTCSTMDSTVRNVSSQNPQPNGSMSEVSWALLSCKKFEQ